MSKVMLICPSGPWNLVHRARDPLVICLLFFCGIECWSVSYSYPGVWDFLEFSPRKQIAVNGVLLENLEGALSYEIILTLPHWFKIHVHCACSCIVVYMGGSYASGALSAFKGSSNKKFLWFTICHIVSSLLSFSCHMNNSKVDSQENFRCISLYLSTIDRASKHLGTTWNATCLSWSIFMMI